MAQNWALGFYEAQLKANAHIHLIAFNVSDSATGGSILQDPYLPDATKSPAEKVIGKNTSGWPTLDLPARDHTFTPHPEKTKLENFFGKCCCFFTEVMLICHGDQNGEVNFILEDRLPKVIGGRPVEKFVLWSCTSSERFAPINGDHFYERLAYQFRPKTCRCGCDVTNCNAFDPNGIKRHCPDGKKATHILTSGGFQGKAAPLGLDLNSSTNSLTSPDGKLRDITIEASGDITAQMTPTTVANVFGGNGTAADQKLAPSPPDPAGEQKFEMKICKASKVVQYKLPEDYHGPERDQQQCSAQLGCMPGGASNPPSAP
jgi:hypothetical protein